MYFCYLRAETVEVVNEEELVTDAVVQETIPSNLIMVKTASGKNVILKVVPQSTSITLDVSLWI